MIVIHLITGTQKWEKNNLWDVNNYPIVWFPTRCGGWKKVKEEKTVKLEFYNLKSVVSL